LNQKTGALLMSRRKAEAGTGGESITNGFDWTITTTPVLEVCDEHLRMRCALCRKSLSIPGKKESRLLGGRGDRNWGARKGGKRSFGGAK